jgi:hypothetical protein
MTYRNASNNDKLAFLVLQIVSLPAMAQFLPNELNIKSN